MQNYDFEKKNKTLSIRCPVYNIAIRIVFGGARLKINRLKLYEYKFFIMLLII